MAEPTVVVKYYGVLRKEECGSMLLDFSSGSVSIEADEVLEWSDEAIAIGFEYAKKKGLV
jgi:hypothetical protein